MLRASRAQFLLCEMGRCYLPLRPERSLCTGQGECRRQVRPHRPPLSHLLEEPRQAWALSSDCSGVVSLTAQEQRHLLESLPLPLSPPPLPNVQSAQIRTALEGQRSAQASSPWDRHKPRPRQLGGTKLHKTHGWPWGPQRGIGPGLGSGESREGFLEEIMHEPERRGAED